MHSSQHSQHSRATVDSMASDSYLLQVPCAAAPCCQCKCKCQCHSKHRSSTSCGVVVALLLLLAAVMTLAALAYCQRAELLGMHMHLSDMERQVLGMHMHVSDMQREYHDASTKLDWLQKFEQIKTYETEPSPSSGASSDSSFDSDYDDEDEEDDNDPIYPDEELTNVVEGKARGRDDGAALPRLEPAGGHLGPAQGVGEEDEGEDAAPSDANTPTAPEADALTAAAAATTTTTPDMFDDTVFRPPGEVIQTLGLQKRWEAYAAAEADAAEQTADAITTTTPSVFDEDVFRRKVDEIAWGRRGRRDTYHAGQAGRPQPQLKLYHMLQTPGLSAAAPPPEQWSQYGARYPQGYQGHPQGRPQPMYAEHAPMSYVTPPQQRRAGTSTAAPVASRRSRVMDGMVAPAQLSQQQQQQQHRRRHQQQHQQRGHRGYQLQHLQDVTQEVPQPQSGAARSVEVGQVGRPRWQQQQQQQQQLAQPAWPSSTWRPSSWSPTERPGRAGSGWREQWQDRVRTTRVTDSHQP